MAFFAFSATGFAVLSFADENPECWQLPSIAPVSAKELLRKK